MHRAIFIPAPCRSGLTVQNCSYMCDFACASHCFDQMCSCLSSTHMDTRIMGLGSYFSLARVGSPARRPLIRLETLIRNHAVNRCCEPRRNSTTRGPPPSGSPGFHPCASKTSDCIMGIAVRLVVWPRIQFHLLLTSGLLRQNCARSPPLWRGA